MYIVAILMFVAGIVCFGLAFSVPGWQAAIFILGILLVAGAMAIPIHTTRRNNSQRLH
jgi:type IV secretory pathway TrbD component